MDPFPCLPLSRLVLARKWRWPAAARRTGLLRPDFGPRLLDLLAGEFAPPGGRPRAALAGPPEGRQLEPACPPALDHTDLARRLLLPISLASRLARPLRTVPSSALPRPAPFSMPNMEASTSAAGAGQPENLTSRD